MAERLPRRLRRIGMGIRFCGMLLVVPLVLAGCGDTDTKASTGPKTQPSHGCVPTTTPAQLLAELDLDGDGTADAVSYVAPSGSCPGILAATVAGDTVSADFTDTIEATTADTWAIRVPGRDGDVLAVSPPHPRGGFQTRLFGYAQGELAELTVDGEPIFPFIATDTLSSPLAARCVDGGFEVTAARAHEPVGVVPAWDIDRTTYLVDGNTVTKGATREVADNVLDEQLRSQYRSLVEHTLFEDCHSGS